MEEEPRILLKNAGNTCLNYKGENIGKLGALNRNLKQERVYRDMHKTMYIYADNSNYEYWKSTHQELVDASTYGKLIELDCDHYLHQFESERIEEEMRDFIDGLK